VAERGLAVAAAEQEDKALQVAAKVLEAMAGWPTNSSSDALRRPGSRASHWLRNCSISASSA
jgi:hypothetical protein